MLKILSFTNVISQIKVTRNKLNKFDYLLHVNALLITTHPMMCCCIYCTKICKTKLTPKKKKKWYSSTQFCPESSAQFESFVLSCQKSLFHDSSQCENWKFNGVYGLK